MADLTFDQIEDAFPEEGLFSHDESGGVVASAQWLHDFANNIHRMYGQQNIKPYYVPIIPATGKPDEPTDR